VEKDEEEEEEDEDEGEEVDPVRITVGTSGAGLNE